MQDNELINTSLLTHLVRVLVVRLVEDTSVILFAARSGAQRDDCCRLSPTSPTSLEVHHELVIVTRPNLELVVARVAKYAAGISLWCEIRSRVKCVSCS